MRTYDFQNAINRLHEAYRKTPCIIKKAELSYYDEEDCYDESVNIAAFRPNIHVYLDCSGSIPNTDEPYRVIDECFNMAKENGVKLIFHSFSHIMSHKTVFPTRNMSLEEFREEFKNTPKVGGGTDFVQIWCYILLKKKTRRQFSVIISDMAYRAPEYAYEVPENLYYFPVQSNFTKEEMQEHINMFTKSMSDAGMYICHKILM